MTVFTEDLLRSSWSCVHFVTAAELVLAPDRLVLERHRLFEVDGTAVTDDQALFVAIAAAMEFPDYFGRNWDALDECLRDLEWTPATGYTLIMRNADRFWRERLRTATAFVESWLFCAESWGRTSVPFHLVFVW